MKVHRFFVEIMMPEMEKDGSLVDAFFLRGAVCRCLENLSVSEQYPVEGISVMDERDIRFYVEHVRR